MPTLLAEYGGLIVCRSTKPRTGKSQGQNGEADREECIVKSADPMSQFGGDVSELLPNEFRLLTELPESGGWWKPKSIETTADGVRVIFPCRSWRPLRTVFCASGGSPGEARTPKWSYTTSGTSNALRIRDLLYCASYTCSVLSDLHRHGIVHLCLAPDNILVNYGTKQEAGVSPPESVTLVNFEHAMQRQPAKRSRPTKATTATTRVDVEDIPGFSATADPQIKRKFREPPHANVQWRNVPTELLMYMAPEAVRKMNRPADERSDFYSFGATLYQVATGRPPFNATDPVDIIFHHMTKTPLAPHLLNQSVPRALSSIIMKCLEKIPENRYSAAQGIKADIDSILQLFNTGDLPDHGSTVANEQQLQSLVESFTLDAGYIDKRSQLCVPRRLLGRERHINVLKESFALAQAGNAELVLVKGYSGVGKSRLVHYAEKIFSLSGCIWIAGKADQYRRFVPFNCFLEAFSELANVILMQSADEVAKWGARLNSTLEGQGRLLTDVTLELKDILGEQEAVPDLPPLQAEQRFLMVTARFLEAVSDGGKPLVIFLDDLQWTDSSTCKLIQYLMTYGGLKRTLIIGAYRSNEVNSTHPLRSSMEMIKSKGLQSAREIELQPLDIESTSELVALMLHGVDKVQLKDLSAVVLRKTGGNPFFVIQLLQSLRDDQRIEFSWESKCWKWDLHMLENCVALTENVADLMVSQIRKLSESTQDTLAIAACIGNVFSIKDLSAATETPPAGVISRIWEALERGYILPSNEETKKMFICTESDDISDDVHNLLFLFSHDRVQQAAYALMPASKQKSVHLLVGNLMLKGWEEDSGGVSGASTGRFFEIVSHLNEGRNLLLENKRENSDKSSGDSEMTSYKLAELNYIAASKAKDATFFESASVNLRVGRSLFPPDCWENPAWYELTMNTYLATVETEMRLQNKAECEALLRVAVGSAKSKLDKAKAYSLYIQLLMSEGKIHAAIDKGLECLKMLGMPLPEDPPSIAALSAKVNALYDTREKIEALLSYPLMQDPTAAMACRILTIFLSVVYFGRPELVVPVINEVALLTHDYGVCAYSAYGFALIGLLHCNNVATIPLGYVSGKAAIELLVRFPKDPICCQVYKVYASHVQPWSERYKNCLPNFLVALQQSINNCDSEYSSYALTEYIAMASVSGNEISSLLERCEPYIAFVQRNGQEIGIAYLDIILGSLRQLTDSEPGEGKPLTEEEQEKRKSMLLISFVEELWKLIIGYIFRDFKAAYKHSLGRETLVTYAPGFFLVAWFYWFESLAILANINDFEDEHRQAALKTVTTNQNLLRGWADSSPANHECKWHLVEAELARVQRRTVSVTEHYDAALKLASDEGFLMEEALIYERISDYYDSLGRHRLARDYAVEAYYSYLNWGASGKATHMSRTNPYVGHVLREACAADAVQPDLDFKLLNEAARQISQEIELSRLVSQLMQVALKISGAQTAVLALEREGKLRIEATVVCEADENHQVETMHQCVEDSRIVPVSVFNYVARTKTSVMRTSSASLASSLLVNPSEAKGTGTSLSFTTLPAPSRLRRSIQMFDPYFEHQQPKSILCIPILRRGKLTGVLYMENNITTDAFTAHHLEILQLLSAQAAVSIENALLYAWLKEQNKKLEEYSKTLSQRVDERMAEITEKNIRLQQEIKERQQAEEAMQIAKEAAEAATIEKSRFLANMSHEIRTPMNAVIGMTECLAHTELTPVQKDYVTILLSSAEELLTLINDILDYSKIESGHLDLEERPFSIQACLDGAIDILTQKAHSHGLELIFAQSFEKPDIVIGDSSRVRQIVCNYLSNAVKFTTEGEIVLSIAAYPFQSFKDAHAMAINPGLFPTGDGIVYTPAEFAANQYHKLYDCSASNISTSNSDAFYVLHIAVTDTGIGIPQDTMTRLFRVFSQVDASTTRLFGGTGLGLAISKRLAELMAGTVWVESESKKGSTFNFTIVVRHENEEPPSTAALHGRSVIILVRNPTIGNVLARYCRMWNMVATSCSSWKEVSALLYGDDTDYTVCLLEPDLLGARETVGPPEGIASSKTVAVIAIVPLGYGAPASCSKADAVLTKPLKMSQLRTKLQEVVAIIDRRPELSPVSPTFTGSLMGRLRKLSRSPMEDVYDLSNLRILLVDDNAVNRKVGAQLLKRLGVKIVDTAMDGNEAIQKLSSRSELIYDIVLMDIQMPVMDGLTATKIIREKLVEPYRNVKIVAVTANAMSGDRDAALAAGMNDYVSKPIFIGDLQAVLVRISSKL